MVSQEEAQRLINISLGKIASYRNQRGSSNLHKNVLVANVLRRVRTTNAEEEYVYQVSDTSSSQDFSNNHESITFTEDSVNAKPNDVFGSQAKHAGDVTMSHGDSDVGDFLIEGCGVSESLNATDSTTNDVSESELTEDNVMRTRNLKRRQSATAEDCVVKRRRDFKKSYKSSMRWRVTRRLSVNDCDSDSETETNIDSVSEQETHILDPKDSTMDVEQICGLVSVFRSSFQGLGYLGSATTEQINNRDANSYSSTKTEGRQNCSLRRGLSLPDLCAKQAVDGLSRQPFKMCTPALALTV